MVDWCFSLPVVAIFMVTVEPPPLPEDPALLESLFPAFPLLEAQPVNRDRDRAAARARLNIFFIIVPPH